MAKIHMVRHGQAAAGFADHSDPGLNQTGQQQAQAVARALGPLGPLAIISSPMARAWQTAEPLAALWNTSIEREVRIAEIPSPTEDLQARSRWLSQAMQGTWAALTAAERTWRDNVVACLLEQTEDCVMFSHYVALNAAVGHAQGDDRMRVYAPDNCSVTLFDNTDGVLRVLDLGRTADTYVN